MVRTIEKNEFSQAFMLNMKPGMQILVKCGNFNEVNTARVMCKLTSQRKEEELMARGIREITGQKVDGNMLLVTAEGV